MNLQESKYQGCIQLAAIGDALGWITEFIKSEDVLEKRFSTKIIDRFYDWEKLTGGRFNGYKDLIRKGSYSDDTQLALAVARSIKVDGTIDNDYFAKIELPNWLSYSRGGGRTVKTSATKIQRRSARWFSNFYTIKSENNILSYREAGANGAAMRVYPIVLANITNREVIKRSIFCNSIITHGHPRAILGAIFFGIALDTILVQRSESFAPLRFVEIIGNSIHNDLALDFISDFPMNQWLNEWNRETETDFLTLFNQTKEELLSLMRIVYKSMKQDCADNEVLEKLGCYNSSTKSSGTNTVAAGIYFSCKYFENPQTSIIKAVNSLGSDTDSIAAFAGALLGALHGVSSVPVIWRDIQDSNYLEKVSEYLLKVSNGEIQSRTNYLAGSHKSLNRITKDDFSEGEIVNFEPLGDGKILSIRRENTLTKGKYNLIMEVSFEIGQTCIFSKLFNLETF